jgi:hypothetical protein
MTPTPTNRSRVRREQGPSATRTGPIKLRARMLTVAVVVAAAVAEGGCTPGSSSPRQTTTTVASSSSSPTTSAKSTTTTSTQSARQQHLLAFAACMRAHGVADFPDPNPDGTFSVGNLSPQSPSIQSAYTACTPTAGGYLPTPNSGGSTTNGSSPGS